MIPLHIFLDCIQENIRRIHKYELGHDGSDGSCDCIGMIIGALRLAGLKWTGTHGSNWAARNAMSTLDYIHTKDDFFLGEVVYKAHEPGEDNYSLPSAYKNSPDQRDYYHIGVVYSVEPLEIVHCTGVEGGIKRDNTLGRWAYGGKLKYVDYSDGSSMTEEPLYKAVVTASNNYPVNLRTGPGTNYDVIEKVELGTEADVLESLGDWKKITCNGLTGYMMSKFLREIGSNELKDIFALLEQATNKLKAYMEMHP